MYRFRDDPSVAGPEISYGIQMAQDQGQIALNGTSNGAISLVGDSLLI